MSSKNEIAEWAVGYNVHTSFLLSSKQIPVHVKIFSNSFSNILHNVMESPEHKSYITCVPKIKYTFHRNLQNVSITNFQKKHLHFIHSAPQQSLKDDIFLSEKESCLFC